MVETQRVAGMQLHVNLKNLVVAVVAVFFLYLAYLLFGPGQPKLPEIWVDLNELITYSILAVERGGTAVALIQKEKSLNAIAKSKTKEGKDEFLTKADLASNQLIYETLSRLPSLSVVSEEKNGHISNVDQYKKNNYPIWEQSRSVLKEIVSEKVALSQISVWVDPLDATQEYTEDLLNYVTVMICIAVNGVPKFGAIHRPFQKQTVWGLVGSGVYPNGSMGLLAEPAQTIVISRSHTGSEIEGLIKDALPGYTIEPAGGAGYKTLRVLDSTAALYLHKTAIKKWDICAGDAIIRAAGGRMLTLKGDEITYLASDPNVKNTEGLLVALKNPFAYVAKLKDFVQSSAVKQSN